MLLAIDIGNSNIVFGVFDGQKWLEKWRIFTDVRKMPDEYAVYFRELMLRRDISINDLNRAVIASVVPQLTEIISEMSEKIFNLKPLIVGPGVKTGLKIKTDNPYEVGADLVVNAVAALNRFKQNCIIADFGTALSFTAVSGRGEFLGAVISAGINMAAEALSGNTAQLPQIRLKFPPKTIGANSINAMQSGILNGYVGAVENIIKKMKDEMGEAAVIATGGGAGLIKDHTDVFTAVEPWLVLEGLRIIDNMNLP